MFVDARSSIVRAEIDFIGVFEGKVFLIAFALSLLCRIDRRIMVWYQGTEGICLFDVRLAIISLPEFLFLHSLLLYFFFIYIFLMNKCVSI